MKNCCERMSFDASLIRFPPLAFRQEMGWTWEGKCPAIMKQQGYTTERCRVLLLALISCLTRDPQFVAGSWPDPISAKELRFGCVRVHEKE